MIKKNITHLAKLKLGEAFVACNLYAPSGIAQADPVPVADVTDDLFSVAFVPDEIGTWTLVLAGAAETVTQQFDCQSSSEAEQRLGIHQIPVELTEIGGLAIPTGNELTGIKSVLGTPSWIPNNTDPTTETISMLINATEKVTFLNSERHRVPYDGLVTGMRIKTTNSTFTGVIMCQAIFFHGEPDAAIVRGRTENISAARLAAAFDSNYVYIEFERPVYCQAGDWIGFRLQSDGSSRLLYDTGILAARVIRQESVGTTDATGFIISSPGLDAALPGLASVFGDFRVVIGDTTPAAGDVEIGEFEIASVNGDDTITLKDRPTQPDATALTWQISTPMHCGRYGITGDASDTAANDFAAASSNNENKHSMAGAPIEIIMNPPLLVVTGDSIMGGSDVIGNEGGTMQSWHSDSGTPYNPAIDLGALIGTQLGISGVNASRGGRDINDFMSGDDDWTYQKDWASVIAYKPGVVIYSTIVNDVLTTFTRIEYFTRLDKLYQQCISHQIEFVMTTGIPMPNRSAAEQVLGKQYREWMYEWASKNLIKIISLHSSIQPTWETADDIFDSTIAVEGFEFPDYQPTGNVHLNPIAYQSLATYLAKGIESPAPLLLSLPSRISNDFYRSNQQYG